jgi:peptidoglycan/xylan/chitin deacetylase (PgdA/CDA1 family)
MKKNKNPFKLLYKLGNSDQKALIDRFRFSIGLLPRVTKKSTNIGWLPSPYQAALVISSDFELGWAYRFSRGQAGSLVRAQQKAELTRRNLPVLLEMFDFYEIPVTWATVGHLFMDKCQRYDGRSHGNLPRPPYFENEYWSYQTGDWYDADPCTDQKSAPEWYAPDLIRNILASKVKHEIGCHTFSHIDCSDGICSPELLRAELTTCKQLANEFGLELKSFVFPGNFSGNFHVLKELGFENYRSTIQVQLGVPLLDKVGLCVIPGGIFWEIMPGWEIIDWELAIQHCIDLAIKKNLVLHLWFHPSCDEVNIKEIFPYILEYIKARRKNIWVVTMKELSDRFLHSYPNCHLTMV